MNTNNLESSLGTLYSRNNKNNQQNGLNDGKGYERYDPSNIIEDSVASNNSNNLVNERTPLISSPVLIEDDGDYPDHEKSTFNQTVFNAINTLAGMAILSLPFAFKYSGWLLGSSIFLFCLIQTNYTAKTIVKCLNTDPTCITYADLARLAFGKKVEWIMGTIFLMDLFNAAVAIMILVGDSLKALFPHYGLVPLKLIACLLVTPITWMPIHFLSHVSLLGIVSAISLAVVVLYDGFTKLEAPGSLLNPMDTYLLPQNWMTLPLAFGLINCGFAGHAVIISLYHDMAKPELYHRMINYSYVCISIIYISVAVSGYLMFGSETMQEITLNIMSTPGYSMILNSIVVWMIVINPLSKIPLILMPINQCIEIEFFKLSLLRTKTARTIYVIISRSLLSLMVILTSIFLPEFDRSMSLLGSFFSFLITGIFPLLCNLKMFGRQIPNSELAWNVILLVMSTIMAILGTIWTFFPRKWIEPEN